MQPTFVLDASERHASGIAYAADGTLWTGGMKGVLRHWKGDRLLADLEGHTSSVNGIAWRGKTMVTVGSDKLVVFWENGRPVDQWKGYEGMACSGDLFLLRKNTGDKVFLHRLGEDRPTREAATGIDRSIGGVWAVPGAWAVAGRGPVLQLRGLDDLSLLAELDGHGTAITSVGVDRSGKTLLVTDAEGGVHLWDLKRRKRLHQFDTGRPGYLFGALSPDGQTIALAGSGVISLHDATGKEIDRDTPGIKGVYGVAWSPDGRHVANAAADGKVRVYAV